MTVRPVRLTIVIADILDIILAADQDDPPWASLIRERSGHSVGAVNPALERLESAGWIASRWEDPKPKARPRRRFYAVTDTGRESYAGPRAERAERRQAWGGEETGRV